MSNITRLLKPEEVADYMGVTLRCVYKLIKDGELAYTKVGRLYRIHPNEVTRFTTPVRNASDDTEE